MTGYVLKCVICAWFFTNYSNWQPSWIHAILEHIARVVEKLSENLSLNRRAIWDWWQTSDLKSWVWLSWQTRVSSDSHANKSLKRREEDVALKQETDEAYMSVSETLGLMLPLSACVRGYLCVRWTLTWKEAASLVQLSLNCLMILLIFSKRWTSLCCFLWQCDMTWKQRRELGVQAKVQSTSARHMLFGITECTVRHHGTYTVLHFGHVCWTNTMQVRAKCFGPTRAKNSLCWVWKYQLKRNVSLTRKVALSNSSTSSASRMSPKLLRLVSSACTFGMSWYTIEDHAYKNGNRNTTPQILFHGCGLQTRFAPRNHLSWAHQQCGCG